MQDDLSALQRHAIKLMVERALPCERAAFLAAFEAATVLPGGMIDTPAVLADAMQRLGHSPEAARAMVADAYANPTALRHMLD